MGAKRSIMLLTALLIAAPALAKDGGEDWIKDTDEIGKTHGGYVRNDQILELGVPTASALQFEGEHSMRSGNIDRALMVLQRSIEMAPMDMDKRILYAEALEKKLMAQRGRKDPRLFNFLVKQWLFVSQKAEFPDQSVLAKTHLLNLTGSYPGLFEKAPKFLSRVLLPEDGSVPVVIGKEKKHVETKTGGYVADRDR